ncbi:hypothetical protein [Candidatus Uabimicrobium sp. HlEnr_7]|uniref:hypothetical protein n=1 Tax=Candidatus Uabimicrobium helgolandensis TaxID=3095367 RepID=UPI0035576740
MAKKPTKKRMNLNKIVQEICAILIGIGIGLYGYESKAALVPMKWQLERKVAKDIHRQQEQQISSGSIFDVFSQIPEVNKFWEKTGANRYIAHVQKYNNVMQKWGITGDLQQKMDSLIKNGVETVPSRWTTPENKPFFILGILLVCIALLTKIAIYSGMLNLNRLGSKRAKRKRTKANVNAIANEFSTFGLSAIGGLYLMPAMENFLRNESTSFPYPWLIAGTFVFLVLLKIALRSSFVDFNSWRRGGRMVSNQRFQRFSKAYNWNTFAHQVTTAILGIFLGFYAYESNLALLPMKWQADRQVGKEVAGTPTTQKQEPGFFDKIWKTVSQAEPYIRDSGFWKKSGAERYVQHAQKYDSALEKAGVKGYLKTKVKRLASGGVDYVPDRWTQKGNLPFLLAALILLALSFIVKWCLYFHIIDFNDWIKRRKLVRKTKKKPPVNWNAITQETASIILGTMIGIYTEPFLDYLAGEANVAYPYPQAGPIIVIVCIAIKVALYMKLISFNKKRVVAKKKKRR